MWSREVWRTARVCPCSFQAVVPPLPPSFSPLLPPAGLQAATVLFGCDYLFSMCDHTAFLTSYPARQKYM